MGFFFIRRHFESYTSLRLRRTPPVGPFAVSFASGGSNVGAAVVIGAAVVGPSGVLDTHGDTRRLFPLASVTKPLVARAAQVAIEEGAVELDTEAGPPGSTVRHLLAHAAGYEMTTDKVIARPGTRRIYSNHGFTVLAEVLEQ